VYSLAGVNPQMEEGEFMADELKEVVVTDIRIPFISLMVLTIKWVIASIPALMILWFLSMAGVMVFWGLMGAVFPW
jgi:hypothetical protein